jgi:hypothetical protein
MNDLLAADTSSPAYALGYLLGITITIGFMVFAVVAVVKAFTRRTAGWIIAGSICGLFLAIPILAFIARIMSVQQPSLSRAAATSGSNAAASDPQREAAAESYLQNLGLEKFTSNEFGFTVMMPKQPTTAKMDIGTMFKGEVNGHSVGVLAQDLPPSDPLYSVESIFALRAELLRGLTRNKNVSDIQIPRNVKDRNGHVGAEMMYTLSYGNVRYHEQGYGFHVGHRVCIVQVTAPEAKWDKQLADSVLTTFGMH